MTLQPEHFPGTVAQLAARAGVTYRAASKALLHLRYAAAVHCGPYQPSTGPMWFWGKHPE